MGKVAKLTKKTRSPRWLHVQLPDLVSPKELSKLKDVNQDSNSAGSFPGLEIPSVRLPTDTIVSPSIRKSLVHSDAKIGEEVQEKVASEKINNSNWGDYIFIDKERIKESMRYFVGGKLAEKSQIDEMLIDFQYLINMYSGYGFPSILSSWYSENDSEWGTHKIGDIKKKIEPDALLNKIFSVLAVYRLSFTVLERHSTFDRTVVIGMLSLLEPILFVKKSLANNKKFKNQLERINFYLNCFYKISVLNKVPDNCPTDFLSLISSVMHLMDNLDFNTLPKSMIKNSKQDIISFLDEQSIPFRALDQVSLISRCMEQANAINVLLNTKYKSRLGSESAIKMRETSLKLLQVAIEIATHRRLINYNVKQAALWIYDYIIEKSTDEENKDFPKGGNANIGGSVIEMNADEFTPSYGASSDSEKTNIDEVLKDGQGDGQGDGTNDRLEGNFYSFASSENIDYLDPGLSKAISDFLNSMKYNGDNSLHFGKFSTSRVVDSGLDLNKSYQKQNKNSKKNHGGELGQWSLSEIDLKRFYEKNKYSINNIKGSLARLCNRYVIRNDTEGEINRSKLVKLIYDTLNGEESKNYKRNRKESIFAHITILRDVSGSTGCIQDQITDTCLKFAMAADLVEGIFVRVVDFQSVSQVRKEFTQFVPSKMQIKADGGTYLESALVTMRDNPSVMKGTHLHLVCIMSDFCIHDSSPRELARTIEQISEFSNHLALLNVAFEHDDEYRAKNFTQEVSEYGIKNVSYEVLNKDRDIAKILSELVNQRLLSIIRGRV